MQKLLAVAAICITAGLITAYAAAGSDRQQVSRIAKNPAYITGRAEWRFAPSVVGSADQGIPIQSALADLEIGLSHPSLGATVGFRQATSDLRALLTLPDSMLTPGEREKWNRLVKALDSFFATPGLDG
jgi:hypothetical protein